MITATADDGIALLTLDDGKANALSTASIAALKDHVERAGATAGAIVITGRPKFLTAGMDLQELQRDAASRREIRVALVTLLVKLFTLERPLVVACTGHALGAGAALLAVADRRVGADGPYKIGFNEASVGAPMSEATLELARYRMPMPAFESVISGSVFDPAGAVSAGLLDAVVDADALTATALAEAERLRGIDPATFAAMKQRARQETADRMRVGLAHLVAEEG